MMNGIQIFGVGETVLDVIFKDDKPLAAVPGGSAFNAMISLGRSVGTKFPDIPIKMITETGDDHIGDIVVNFLQENNVSAECVTRNEGTQTHISMAFLNERNDAHYEFYKDHAHANLSSDKFESVKFRNGDILLTSSYFAINPVIRDYTRSLFQKAQTAGTMIYYDVNFRSSHINEKSELWGSIIENFRFSTVVRGSTEDFQILFGTADPQDVYDKYISTHCQLFICTDGGNPLTLITPTFTATYPVAPIETVSTIGAGDNFNAGFIYGMIEQSVGREDLLFAGKDIWDKLIASGQTFSAKVCQSIYNYIP